MKKIAFFLGLTAALLCTGCDSVPEETGSFDYDAMDKQFGQMQDEEVKNDIALYEEELDEISDIVGKYADNLVTKDSRACAESFADEFLSMIMNAKGCGRREALDIAEESIEVVFQTKEKSYRELAKEWSIGHKTEIKKICGFSQMSTLKEIYAGYGVKITDAIDVDFTLQTDSQESTGEIRLVKLPSGEWKPDMSFFEI